MTAPPFPFVYEAEGLFRVLPGFLRRIAEHYGQGEIVALVPHEERSDASHKHEFAWLRDVWASLPERLAADFPNPEMLRKRALIGKGWCTVKDYPCASHAEAKRLAATLRAELDEYVVVIISDDVVRVCRAKSQAKNKMGKADFQASKQDVIDWVSDLIGADPSALSRHARAT